MAIIPNIPTQSAATYKCGQCASSKPETAFAHTHSIFYPNHRLPICNDCVGQYLKDREYSWEALDKLCQWADIPWIVKEWTRLGEINEIEDVWPIYARTFAADAYKNLGWADYNSQYIKLREAGVITDEIPLLNEDHLRAMRETWGSNYSAEELNQLEDLYKGMLVSQNINGALQIDQARKICKLSLEIDSRIRAGDKEVDKFLSSYDKLVKTAEFTPKNTKNAVDFDSFAEVGYWLEKRGKQNKFYDNVTRDVIDETLKNIEAYNQRLYINEGGIGEEITSRLEALKNANTLEEQTFFDLQPEFDEDEYENAGFNVEGDFNPEGDTFNV